MSKVEQLTKAVENNNLKDIRKILDSIKNIRTAYSYYYKFIKGKVSKDIQDKIYTYYVEPLILPRIEEYKESVKKVKKINEADIREILDNKDKNDKYKLIYILLLTGRRLNEVLNNPVIEVKDNKLFMKLSKNENPEFEHIKILNNQETPESIKNMIENITVSYKSAPTLLKRLLSPYGLSAHDLRGVYIELIYKFYNPKQRNKSSIVMKYLNHKGFQKSYDHIEYKGGNPFKSQMDNLNKMKVKELRKLAKERELKKYSKLKKSDLIKLLSS